MVHVFVGANSCLTIQYKSQEIFFLTLWLKSRSHPDSCVLCFNIVEKSRISYLPNCDIERNIQPKWWNNVGFERWPIWYNEDFELGFPKVNSLWTSKCFIPPYSWSLLPQNHLFFGLCVCFHVLWYLSSNPPFRFFSLGKQIHTSMFGW